MSALAKIHKGGPAFPCTTVNDSDVNLTDPFGTLLPPGSQTPYPGMSLRDYFAAIALPECMRLLASEGNLSRHGAADSAYLLADAMLAARRQA